MRRSRRRWRSFCISTGERPIETKPTGNSVTPVSDRRPPNPLPTHQPWTEYWQQQAYPVMLVVRTSDGVIRWMDVSAPLRELSKGGVSVTQIEFEGDALDVLDVLRKRDEVLRGGG